VYARAWATDRSDATATEIPFSACCDCTEPETEEAEEEDGSKIIRMTACHNKQFVLSNNKIF
jgi:hypothetical protein